MEKKNFYDFIKVYKKIIIPKIQREYVQGQNERGETFIRDIFEHLNKNKEYTLDLVYGYNNDDVFEPVDGQQRLTTLFLLYWYIGKIELTDGSEDKENLEKELKKFSYDTRESSKKFCEEISSKLTNESFELTKEDIPSETISVAFWFFEKYKYDYTVKSMLSMLDIIQKNYIKYDTNFYNKLDKLTFNVYDMKDYSLGEELYVIMNDRGKALSPFENLKSSFLEWVNIEDPNLYKELAKKIDSEWTETIWTKCRESDSKKDACRKSDAIMYQFFIRYIWVTYTAITEKTNKEILKQSESDAYNVLYKAIDKVNEKSIEELDFDTYFMPLLNEIKNRKTIKTFINDLSNYIDFYLKNEKQVEKFLASKWNNDKTEIASIFTDDKFALSDIFINYALQLFIENNEIDDCNDETWKEWYRFVWNILESKRTKDSIDNAVEAIMLIYKYKDCTQDILKALADNNSSNITNNTDTDTDDTNTNANNISSVQSVESEDSDEKEDKNEKQEKEKAEKYEGRKASYILNQIKENDDWRKEFDKIENHSYLKGYIDFIIKDSDDKESFIKRADNLKYIFPEDRNGLNDNDKHLVLRALFSQRYELEYNKSNNKPIVPDLLICDTDTKRGKLKTVIKNRWSDYIRNYIEMSDIAAIKNRMNSDCENCKSNYNSLNEDDKPDHDFIFWQNILCNNADLMDWIQERSIIRDGVSFIKLRNSTRLYFGGKYNGNSVQIWLDKEYHKWNKIITDNGYTQIKPDTNEKDNFDLEFKVKNNNNDFILYISRSAIYFEKTTEKDKYMIIVHSEGDIDFVKNNKKEYTAEYSHQNDQAFINEVKTNVEWF